jgi:hypothetical protein
VRLWHQQLNRNARTEADFQHTFVLLHAEQIDCPSGVPPIGACHDGTAQPAKQTAWPAEHVHQDAAARAHPAATCVGRPGCQNAVRGIKSRQTWRIAGWARNRQPSA